VSEDADLLFFLFVHVLCVGFLAEKAEEYAAVFADVLDHYAAQQDLLERARASVTRFSDELFGQKFVAELEAAVR
jgi:hypothetical protein